MQQSHHFLMAIAIAPDATYRIVVTQHSLYIVTVIIIIYDNNLYDTTRHDTKKFH